MSWGCHFAETRPPNSVAKYGTGRASFHNFPGLPTFYTSHYNIATISMENVHRQTADIGEDTPVTPGPQLAPAIPPTREHCTYQHVKLSRLHQEVTYIGLMT